MPSQLSCGKYNTYPAPTSTYRKLIPPLDICDIFNNHVRSNHTLGSTNFDFTEHVRNRSYAMHNFLLDGFEGTALLDEEVEELLPDSFEAPHPVPSGMFEIADAGDKGLGMFALRDIPAGSVILAEHPIVIIPYLLGIPTPSADLYAVLFSRLSPGARRELLSLANPSSTEGCNTLDGIMRTNALGIHLEVPKTPHSELALHRAIFLNTSRCNHSCGPNAQWAWDLNSFSLYLSALRPIRAGEEITIQYCPTTCPRHERQITLQSLYRFTCRCHYCTLPSPEAVFASDAARSALGRFWHTPPTFEQWCLDPSMHNHALINLHLNALQLIDQEGLQILSCNEHENIIAMCYGALEDVEMFKLWTTRVRDGQIQTNPSRALVFSKWLSNPMSFPAWGWKKTFCGSRTGRHAQH